jgi:Tfp pilus assembly protein PilO
MKWTKAAVFAAIGLCVAALLFFLGAVFHTTLGTPSETEIDRRLDRLKQREQAVVDLKESLAEWRAVEKTFASFKDDRLYRFARFPEFRQTLDSLLNRSSLRVSRFNYKIRQSLADIVQVTLDLDVDGTYANVKRFIHEVEILDKILFFKQVQLNKGSAGIEGRISMEAYFVR